MVSVKETIGTVHRYAPRGAAHELFGTHAGEVLLAGPAGTGKSRAALEKLHATALAVSGMRGLIVRKTLSSLGTTALVTWREHVIAEALDAGLVDFYGGSPEQPPQYRYPNGSIVAVGGMDKSTRIMSSEYDMIFVQEAIELTVDDWEAITSRLRNGKVSYQQLIADTNPSTPTHWLKARCDRGQALLLHSRHEDNPRLYAEPGRLTGPGAAYMARLDALTGVRRERLRYGRWVAAEGMIYEDWDEAVHLIPHGAIPDEWARYLSVDFGYTNPFVAQWWAEDPDGRLVMYREIYQTQRLVEQHALDIAALSEHEPRARAIVCDHDAEGRATLEKYLHRSTRGADKRVTVGIQEVASRLGRTGDGRPRLSIMRGALVHPTDPDLLDAKRPTCTAEEIPGYVWDVAAGKAPKEVPRKEDDHGMDAMRYLVMFRARGKRQGVRFL
jgi:phage terminase large subunit